MKSKPAYSLIFAFLVMTVIMLIASTTVTNTNEKLVYFREMEGPVNAKLAAESVAETAILAIKDYNAGYEAEGTDTFTRDLDGDGVNESWANFTVYSKARELPGSEGTAIWYTPMPGTGTAGDPDSCSVLDDNADEEGDEDHPCNWNKLLYGESVTIPLYSDDGSGGISIPDDLGFNSWELRVRTPCEDGSLDDANCTRYELNEDDSTGTFSSGGDSVIFWQLVGEDSSGNPVSLVPDDEDYEDPFSPGFIERSPGTNTEIYEALINTEASSDYVVLEANSTDSLYSEVYNTCTDTDLAILSLQLDIVTPLQEYGSSGDPIPYLEWQLVTDSNEPFADTKAVIIGEGYHQGTEGIFYYPIVWTRNTTGESTNIYTLSN